MLRWQLAPDAKVTDEYRKQVNEYIDKTHNKHNPVDELLLKLQEERLIEQYGEKEYKSLKSKIDMQPNIV